MAARLEHDEQSGVWVLRLASAEAGAGHWANTFTPRLVSEVHAALDVVERSSPGPCALVVAAANAEQGNKFFCNGHDLQWLENAAASGGTDEGSEAAEFIRAFYALLARFMTAPFPTVAAVTGHAFAGGCLLAMAQDYRVMRADRGFMCMNEVDMALAAPAGPAAAESHIKPGAFRNADAKMTAVLLAKLSPLQVRNMYLPGTRFDGPAALRAGLVDRVQEGAAATLAAAKELAAQLAPKAVPRNRRTVAVLKTELVRPVLALLRDGEPDSKL